MMFIYFPLHLLHHRHPMSTAVRQEGASTITHHDIQHNTPHTAPLLPSLVYSRKVWQGNFDEFGKLSDLSTIKISTYIDNLLADPFIRQIYLPNARKE